MKLLTVARDLARRRARERQGLFVAEGVRTVEELLRSPLRIRGALAGPRLAESPRGRALVDELHRRTIALQEVTASELASASDTDTPQGIVAIAEVPQLALESLPAGPRYLVLDGIQDPGNTGTILRTAAALGVTATIALPGTVDLWNAKVVRSGMGAHFHHPALASTWEALDTFLRDRDIVLWGAAAAGEPLDDRTGGDGKALPAPLALAVGNEGSGLSTDARERARRLVALPIAPAVESLNVAVATGIFLYQLRP